MPSTHAYHPQRQAGEPAPGGGPVAALSAVYQAELPDDFLPDEAEGLAFQRAFARAALPDFQCGCVVVSAQGRRVAVAPVFVMRFSIATMLPPGRLKRLLGGLSLRIACVGHPSADIGRVEGALTPAVLAAINGVVQTLAPVMAYKGFGFDLALPDFVRVFGLPVPVLQLKPDHLQSLPSHRRRDLVKKRLMGAGLRWETVRGLDSSLVDAVYALYLQTYERANVQFEKLNRAYFVETAGLSEYILAFEDERLIGFAQLLTAQGQMLFKYVGMDYAIAHRHGLYFGLLIRMVEHAQSEGLQSVDFGVTAYDFKCRLGAGLHETAVYYRHRNPLLHRVLRLAAPLLEPGPDELA